MNVMTSQFHWDIMNSMAKVQKRMGGSVVNDEDSLQFVS